MAEKRKNPYEMLREDVRSWVWTVVFPRRIPMWTYKKRELGSAYTMNDLYQRVAAADQLGYDVRLAANDEGLRVEYVKRPSLAPFAVRP